MRCWCWVWYWCPLTLVIVVEGQRHTDRKQSNHLLPPECWMLGDGTVRVGVNSAALVHFEVEKTHQCTQILHLPLALDCQWCRVRRTANPEEAPEWVLPSILVLLQERLLIARLWLWWWVLGLPDYKSIMVGELWACWNFVLPLLVYYYYYFPSITGVAVGELVVVDIKLLTLSFLQKQQADHQHWQCDMLWPGLEIDKS